MIILEISNTIEKNQIDIKSKKKDTDKSMVFDSNKEKERKIEQEVQEIYKDVKKEIIVNLVKKINQL